MRCSQVSHNFGLTDALGRFTRTPWEIFCIITKRFLVIINDCKIVRSIIFSMSVLGLDWKRLSLVKLGHRR